MIPNQTDRLLALRRAFGRVAAPPKITQEAFEGNDRHLSRLVRLKSDERAEPDDLWKYTQDLLYTEIQGPLLAYVLPFCLEVWREDLRGIHNGYGGFVEQFYPVLANRHVFDAHLTQKQSAAVSEFMRQTILEEIDDQRGLSYQGTKPRPYRWVGALTTLGVLLPDVERLWTAWWSVNTVGRAISAVQYISCLMYSENENPVFAPWTPNGGGGPPCLWEFEGHLYTHRWLEPNVTFLKGVLNVPGLSEVLTRAVERLVDQPEHDVAALMKADVPLLIETLQARCAELPQLLETTQEPSRLLAWTT
jgi:hypothetical protein